MGGISRYWVGVGWIENLREDWQEVIGEVLQLPYCYIVHDQDLDKAGQLRKPHMHLIVAWPNTTTAKNALNVFRGLDRLDLGELADQSDPDDDQLEISSDQKKPHKPTAFNKVQVIYGMRFMYNYLIHDTDRCKSEGKHLYQPEERITGNGFDVGFLEQLSVDEKNECIREMVDYIKDEKLVNYLELYESMMKKDRATVYLEVLKSNVAFFKAILTGNWQRITRAEYYPKKEPEPKKEQEENDKSEV